MKSAKQKSDLARIPSPNNPPAEEQLPQLQPFDAEQQALSQAKLDAQE
ncbi:MAG: hypothetical protein KDB22_06675 [Planctomycetales bacterium]|nr:hypothetical protein [Planctomycetales bacterium]